MGRKWTGDGGKAKRDVIKPVRWSKAEWAQVVEMAGKQSPSEFIRQCVLHATGKAANQAAAPKRRRVKPRSRTEEERRDDVWRTWGWEWARPPGVSDEEAERTRGDAYLKYADTSRES